MRNLRAKLPQHNIQPIPRLEPAERVRLRLYPFPVRYLTRRYGLSASTALQVAELIGYAVGGDR